MNFIPIHTGQVAHYVTNRIYVAARKFRLSKASPNKIRQYYYRCNAMRAQWVWSTNSTCCTMQRGVDVSIQWYSTAVDTNSRVFGMVLYRYFALGSAPARYKYTQNQNNSTHTPRSIQRTCTMVSHILLKIYS